MYQPLWDLLMFKARILLCPGSVSVCYLLYISTEYTRITLTTLLISFSLCYLCVIWNSTNRIISFYRFWVSAHIRKHKVNTLLQKWQIPCSQKAKSLLDKCILPQATALNDDSHSVLLRQSTPRTIRPLQALLRTKSTTRPQLLHC